MGSINKSYFWSYEIDNIPRAVQIEQILKYGDISEINTVIKNFGNELCFKIWLNKIIPDSRFDRLNYFLARFVFKISDEKKDIINFIKTKKRTRFENRN